MFLIVVWVIVIEDLQLANLVKRPKAKKDTEIHPPQKFRDGWSKLDVW